MKVLLLQDVAKIGKRHQVVEVPDGHAMNMLIPRKLAIPATAKAVKRISADSAAKAKGVEKTREELVAWSATLSSEPLQIAVSVNAQGHLFEAVKAQRISEALRLRGMQCEPSLIAVDVPIKTVGTHDVAFTFHHDRIPFTISVIPS